MTEYRPILESLGLTPQAADAYLELLKLGRSNVSDLARAVQMKRPTMYLALETLLRKELVTEVQFGRRKHYVPVHPRRLLEMARTKAKTVERVVPELAALHYSPKSGSRLQLLEGAAGVRSVYGELFDSLHRKSEALFFTHIEALKSSLPMALDDYKQMLRRLRQPRVRELDFGDSSGREWAKEMRHYLESNPNHQLRLTPTEHRLGSTDFLIYESKVALFSFSKPVSVVLIENVEIAASMRAMFEFAWLVGKPPW
jgi:sugar-specific transcriptional regulator TrmB